MEGLILLVVLILLFMFVGSLIGILAMVVLRRHQREYESEVSFINRRLRNLEAKAQTAGPATPVPETKPAAAVPTTSPPAPSGAWPGPAQAPAAQEPPPLSQPVSPVPPAIPSAEPIIPIPAPGPTEPGAVVSPGVQAPSTTESARREWWADFEQRAGKRWMTWGGAVVLILSAGFFAKYAIDNEWFPPAVRDVIGMVFGAALVGLGVHFVRKAMGALGQGLIGGGLAILYISLYAAYGFHGWLPQMAAFGAMVIVSAAGIALAVRYDAIPVSLLAILGGFITPVMVSTGQDQRDIVFAYLLLLDVTVLGVSWFKRWRLLDVLAFAGTAALFVGWFTRFYAPDAMVPALLWLGAFYAIFLILPFVNHLRTRTPITIERFVMALGNAAGACVLAWQILRATHPHTLGSVVMGMSAAYLVFAALSRTRIPEDVKSPFSFLALSITFFTMAIPLHFGLNGVTLCWAAQVPALVYLGYKYKYWPVRLAGFLMLVVAVVRFFARHWPLHDHEFTLFINGQFGMAMWVAAAGAAYALLHHWQRKDSSSLDRALKVAAAVAAGFLALLAAHFELAQWFSFTSTHLTAPPEYFSRVCTSVLWALGALAFLAAGIRGRSVTARLAGLASFVIALALVAFLYATPGPAQSALFLNLRFLSALAAALTIFVCGAMLTRGQGALTQYERALVVPVYLLAGYILLVLVTTESFTFSGRWPAWCFAVVVWALGTAGFEAAGLWGRSGAARAAASVALFVAVAFGVRLYALELPATYDWFFNPRFASAMLVVLASLAGAIALVRARDAGAIALLRARDAGTDREQALLGSRFAEAAYLLLTLLTAENFTYRSGWPAWCVPVAVWAAGAVVLVRGGVRWPNATARRAGAFAVFLSSLAAVRLYAMQLPEGYLLFLNPRFVVCLAPVAAAFIHAFLVAKHKDLCGPGGEYTGNRPFRVAMPLYACGIFLLLLLLSTEPYLYCLRTVSDRAAAWSAQMSLTVVWSVYATGMLAVGFWKKTRPLRFAALGLFGLTGLKLVAIDLASVGQAYRIISFFVMGMLMIAASYFYHKVEKLMAARAAEQPK